MLKQNDPLKYKVIDLSFTKVQFIRQFPQKILDLLNPNSNYWLLPLLSCKQLLISLKCALLSPGEGSK